MKAPKKGRVEIGGKGCFDSWIVGDWTIVEVDGAFLGCKRGVKNKRGFLLHHLPTGQEHKIVPDYENDYDLNYTLWYAKKVERILRENFPTLVLRRISDRRMN